MQKIFTLLIILLFSISLQSQRLNIDSLKNVFNTQSKEDTSKLNTLQSIIKIEKDIDLENTLFYIDKAIDLSKSYNDKRKEGIFKAYKGLYYGRKKQFDKALEFGIESVRILDSLGTFEEKLFANSELNSYYRVTGNQEQALKLSLKNLELAENENSPQVGRYLFEVGNTYGTLKNYSEAEKYFKESMALAKKTNFVPAVMINKFTLIEVYYLSKQYQKIMPLANEIEQYYIDKKDKNHINKVLFYKAIVFIENNEYSKAIVYLEKAEKGFDELGDLKFKKNCLKNLFYVNALTNDKIKADAYYEKYGVVGQKILDDKQKKIVEELKVKYDTENIEKEKEIALEKASINRKLFIASIIGALLILLSTILIIHLLSLKKRTEFSQLKLKEAEKTLHLERKYRNAELKALKAQMNPHFLFNAFNSIQEYIIMNNKELASEYLGKFADLMRLYLEQSRSKSISLSEEIRSLSLYLELEKIRFDDTLNYYLEIDEGIHAEMINVPPLILQPFVENALKHGLLHKKNDRKLWINFKYKSNNLICKVKDNGVGRKKSSEINSKKERIHKSFAISSIVSRIELVNVTREKDIDLKINDLYDNNNNSLGTEIVLTIPF